MAAAGAWAGRTLVADLEDARGAVVTVAGWVHRVRSLGRVAFVLLRDRSGVAQLVFPGAVDVSAESVITATGTVEANERAPGGFEVQVREHRVLSAAAGDLPLAVNGRPENLSLDAQLDHRMLALRIPKLLDVFRVQATIVESFARHLRGEGFTEIKTAKLIGSGTEGGTGLFAVRYFDREVFLAQSPQLYKQAMVAAGLERVFEVGHAYRAEKHDTPRHLNEYVSLDVELAFIDSEHDLMDLEQRILKTIFAAIAERNGRELAAWGASVPDAAAVDALPRLNHDQALRLASDRLGRRSTRSRRRWSASCARGRRASTAPRGASCMATRGASGPSTTHPAPDGKTMSFDLLFRGVEITTGGRRIEQHDLLAESITANGLSVESLADYLQVFRYGCPPHGGFAIGLERLTQRCSAWKTSRRPPSSPVTANAPARERSSGHAMSVPQPFQYQGSKRLLAPRILDYLPVRMNRLVEPFAGSAAVSLACARRARSDEYWLNDANRPLTELLSLIVDRPEEIADYYRSIWRGRAADHVRHYHAVRDRFNRTHDPRLLLYLLARCVKSSVRYNSDGDFNQSPDKRRLGTNPPECGTTSRRYPRSCAAGRRSRRATSSRSCLLSKPATSSTWILRTRG